MHFALLSGTYFFRLSVTIHDFSEMLIEKEASLKVSFYFKFLSQKDTGFADNVYLSSLLCLLRTESVFVCRKRSVSGWKRQYVLTIQSSQRTALTDGRTSEESLCEVSFQNSQVSTALMGGSTLEESICEVSSGNSQVSSAHWWTYIRGVPIRDVLSVEGSS